MTSKILVIFTGGTIGSKMHRGVLDVEASAKYLLLEKFYQQYSLPVEFDTVCPFEILSENMNHTHWQILCDTIRETDTSKYKGVIITHGSDTLPYTAALLSFAFPDLTVPLVLVSSHYPLTDPRENGTACFGGAVRFILEKGNRGVYAVCHDKEGKLNVHLGTRLLPCDAAHDAFSDFDEVPYGAFHGDALCLNPVPSLKIKPSASIGRLTFDHHVLVIHAHPNTDYRTFCPTKKTRAVLHTLYHSNTACTAPEPYALPNFIKKCKAQGIDFYLLSESLKPQETYQTTAELTKCGAVHLGGISLPAAYAKLYVAYAQNAVLPKVFMQKNIAGEFLEHNTATKYIDKEQ